MNFEDFNLSEKTLYAINEKGFEKPTPVQKRVIPILLNKEKNLIVQAKTGTGKTAAFGIPLIELLESKGYVQAIILTPTRELALQVSEEINSLKRKRLKILPVYGGQSISRQIEHLKRGVDIVVGTPGRILDHLERKTIDLSKVEYFILDEADEMLDMGFIDDVEKILKSTSDEKIFLMFSATIPRRIIDLAKKYIKNYEVIKIADKQLTTNLTEQIYIELNENDKFEALCRIIDVEDDFYGMVFCRTKVEVDNVSSKLIERGYDAEALHGDFSQYQRERVLKKFKEKRINILVATDVAARGIDISGLTHVINYSIPLNPEHYVHRVGRTGRAGREGVAITFVTPKEYRQLFRIKKFSKAKIKEGKIPSVEQIIRAKSERIKSELLKEEKKLPNIYYNLADELLKKTNPREVIAKLLNMSFKSLNPEKYEKVLPPKENEVVRLFIAKGKQAGLTKKDLVRFIVEKTNISPKVISDVVVLDKFSFITVPYKEAEIILSIFKKRGRRSLISKAKERN
ncbi:RNA helicase [Thermosipho melanesiensis]|uniref:RNA helicase n=2 Tax=Thermosipho melanesiensis TaxID=46541 RepID=A6LL98_THEM4|nr:DEAD/DEAH box helicase [Thermosipho melanesiensis]ABR30699.1 DEAD/DEAH box helicase domain protein [Thermosipho melanesiensis BI429]APT73829.1 RNA helicase [Thermosipho melanesiensis]OOC35768.1 RNA helicase [Thermosipho melanesiensis]OOC39067.1 RNA helicase [Thermosipho melanesiensis]OOC39215.1 RNA helicase [Thermosipho melanesiensis]